MNLNKEFVLILCFTFLAFILGTTDYVIVGLLSDIALSLDVTLAQAGILVSGFAIAYAVGTPFAMMAASYVPKRTAILTGVMLIVVLNVISAFVPSYAFLLVIRMLTAIFCGLSVSLSMSICMDAVALDKKGKAIAFIMGGFSIATILGVPIGTFVGLQYKWQYSFFLVALLSLVCWIILYNMIPRGLTATKSSASSQLKVILNPRIALAFCIPVIGVAGLFVIYTYITPLLTEVMNIPIEWTSWFLLLYGCATIISNVISGKIASGDYVQKLKRMFIVHAVIYIVYGMTMSYNIIGMVSLMSIACISFSINAAAQLYLIDLTEGFVPQAKDFANSLLPIGANIGIAIGSSVGALVTNYLGLRYLPWVAVIFALLAFSLTALSWKLDHKKTTFVELTHN